MALNKKETDEFGQFNTNFIQLSDSIREVAVMISKTDIRLENIKVQQHESMKKIEKIEEFINNFSSLENKIKIIEQKDLVMINKEVEELKNDFKKIKEYIDELFKRVENHRSKIWEVKGDTKEIKVFKDGIVEKSKSFLDILFKASVSIFIAYFIYKMGWKQ